MLNNQITLNFKYQMDFSLHSDIYETRNSDDENITLMKNKWIAHCKIKFSHNTHRFVGKRNYILNPFTFKRVI